MNVGDALVNDVHSGLNETRVAGIVRVVFRRSGFRNVDGGAPRPVLGFAPAEASFVRFGRGKKQAASVVRPRRL